MIAGENESKCSRDNESRDSLFKDDSLKDTNGCETDSEHDEKSLKIDESRDKKTGGASLQKSEEKIKRTANHDNPAPSKKTRSKPKPQAVENMQQHIENNTVEKLTIATLLNWLKEKSIHCTTRDKKAILIEKVKAHFLSKTKPET